MDDEKLYKLLEYIKPINSFDNSKHPLTPDYSDLNNWAAYPNKDAQQFYVPDSNHIVNKTNNDVDVFYIHPTGYFEKFHDLDWNKTIFQYPRSQDVLRILSSLIFSFVLLNLLISLSVLLMIP